MILINRILLIAVIAAAFAPEFISGQHNPSADKKTAAVPVWRKVELKKWGVESIELPDNLLAIDDQITSRKNDRISWTDRSARWSPIPNKPGPKFFWVSVDATTWDGPYSQISPRLKPDLATPEYILENGVAVDMRYVTERKDLLIQEAGYHEIDGVRGGRSIALDRRDRTRTMVDWWTFRYFNGKPHRVMIQLNVANNDLPAAMRIIDSLRLEKLSN